MLNMSLIILYRPKKNLNRKCSVYYSEHIMSNLNIKKHKILFVPLSENSGCNEINILSS